MTGPLGGAVEPARACTETYSQRVDCIDALAGRYITELDDLCGPCTRRLMDSLDWIAGRDHEWHPSWIQRAGGAR